MNKFITLLILLFALVACGGGNGNNSDDQVTTSNPQLISLLVTPATSSIFIGDTQQFTATGTYSDDTTKDLTSSVTWTSSDTAVATVNTEGLAASLSTGTATITATSGNISGSATIKVKDALLESPFGYHMAGIFHPGYDNNGYGDAQYIGVKWARDGIYAYWFIIQPDLNQQTYDFSIHDEQWSKVPEGIMVLVNIAPEGDTEEGYYLSGSYLPIDDAKYTAFVKATVERYDGDGIDDMPGLMNPIKYWQVGNEPDDAVRKDFAELQRITYLAIKEVCPDCMVLIGGAPGRAEADNTTDFDIHYKPILDALNGQYVDVMDFHWFRNATGDYLGAKQKHDYIRSVLDADGFSSIPIWITEMGSYSGDPFSAVHDDPLQTERQQALDYFKRFVYPLSFGVKKIFPAFGLMEGYMHDGSYFDYTGLIYDGWDLAGTTPSDLGLGVKKLGYYTYKKMTETLEGADWENIEIIREAGDVYVYKFSKNGKPIYAAWWDYFNDPTYTSGMTTAITITGVQGSKVIVTEVVPHYSAGIDVSDYSTAFTMTELIVSDGAVTLNLGDSPVLMEVME